jgi:hypothetical protein
LSKNTILLTAFLIKSQYLIHRIDPHNPNNNDIKSIVNRQIISS